MIFALIVGLDRDGNKEVVACYGCVNKARGRVMIQGPRIWAERWHYIEVQEHGEGVIGWQDPASVTAYQWDSAKGCYQPVDSRTQVRA